MSLRFAGLRVLPDGGDLHGRQPHPAAAAEGREQRLDLALDGPVRGAAGMGPRRPGQPGVPRHRLGTRRQAQDSPRDGRLLQSSLSDLNTDFRRLILLQ